MSKYISIFNGQNLPNIPQNGETETNIADTTRIISTL